MAGIRPIRQAGPDRAFSTAQFLRGLADRAEAGEFIGAICVLDQPHGNYRVEWNAGMSRLQRMGAMFDAATSMANSK